MKKLRFVVSLITQENDYQRHQAAAAEEAARRLDVDLAILYAGSDAIQQGQQLLELIQGRADARPDAIIVEPAGTAMPHVAKAASMAGIGWAVLNCDPDYLADLRARSQAPACAINIDNVEVGRIQGRQFGALLPQGGTLLYIEGPGTTVPAQHRKAGMNATLPRTVQVRSLKGSWTEQSGFNTLNSLLNLSTSRELRVGVIGSQNDAMALGARKAVQALSVTDPRRQWLTLPFTGCDGVPESGQAWVQQGLLRATVVTPPLAGVAIGLLADALRAGKQPPEKTTIPPSSYPALERLAAPNASAAKAGA